MSQPIKLISDNINAFLKNNRFYIYFWSKIVKITISSNEILTNIFETTLCVHTPVFLFLKGKGSQLGGNSPCSVPTDTIYIFKMDI